MVKENQKRELESAECAQARAQARQAVGPGTLLEAALHFVLGVERTAFPSSASWAELCICLGLGLKEKTGRGRGRGRALQDEVSRPPQPASVEAWHVVTVGETALLHCS